MIGQRGDVQSVVVAEIAIFAKDMMTPMCNCRIRRLLVTVAFLMLLSGCADRSFTFVHMTDPQIGFHDASPEYVHSDTLMQRAVELANGYAPDLVFITGDLVDKADDAQQEAIFSRNLSAIAAPVWLVPGNHDIRGYTPEKRDAYVGLRGYDHFAFRYNGCAFIGFDTNCIKDEAGEAEAEQFAWLTEELRKAKKARYTFVFLHCPVVRETLDEPEDYFNFSSEARARYLALFKEYGVDAVFAGHTHCPYVTEIDGIAFYTGTAVGNCLHGARPGFNLVRVMKKGVAVEQVNTFFSDCVWK